MTRFLAMRWSLDDGIAARRAQRVETVLGQAGWACAVDRPGWRVWCDHRAGRWTLVRLHDDTVVVLGRLFERTATEAGCVAEAALPDRCPDFEAFCAGRVRKHWGGYVALRADLDRPRLIEMFRDPVGAMDCATWACSGLRLVASHPEAIIADAPPAGFGIDWPGIADVIRRPVVVSDRVALAGVDPVPPGTLVRIDGRARSDRCLWSPATFAARPAPPGPAVIRAHLVDACTAAWASCAHVAVAELSGGLDSAIVAAGAVAAGAPIRACFNYHAIDPGGDERRFAQSTADRLGLPLETIFRPDVPIAETDIDTMPAGMRLGFGRTNIIHDADLARRASALDADMLLTGNGGDSVFFQHPSPLLAADLRGSGDPLRTRIGVLLSLSQWTGSRIWSLAAIAAGLRRPALDMPDSGCSFLSPDLPADGRPIGWMSGTEALPPAKRLHILTLSIARSSFGPSWCGERLSVVHPLMSQPILEHVLPIPALALTQGQRDRALARAAYADRLPASLIARRGKGCLTAYLGRRLAASTDFLKDYLLGGLLAANRVVDPARLEPILEPEYLMQTDAYAGLLLALLAERWARVWSDRIRDSRADLPSTLAIA